MGVNKFLQTFMAAAATTGAILAAILTLSIFVSAPASAQQPTQEQIEQFKRLSPAEQQAIARSMGLNLQDMEQMLQESNNAKSDPFERQVSGNRNSGALQPNSALNGTLLPAAQNPNELGIEESIMGSANKPSLEEDESPESVGQKLELFGYDIFDYGPDSFTPSTDIPIPANYLLGAGDTLVIQLYGKQNSTHTVVINREGQIQFPDIGPITLAGMTFEQAVNKVDDIVGEQMIGIRASVTLGTLRTIRVFVLGEARIPGSYIVGSLSTMTNAIFASGGVTKIGSLRHIQLKRAGKLITELDLYDLLLHGDTAKDSRLQPGDVIFIPPIGKTVGVSGEVKRPAIYELQNEKQVSEALELAGGLLPTAYMPASRIERITDSGEKTLVNLDISTDRGRKFPLKDADVLQVYSTLDTMRDIVKLEGHVKRPGGFAWREQLRFTDIVPNIDSLLANPDIEIGLIQRELKDTRKIMVEPFSPKAAFDNPGSPADPILETRDTIILFDYETNRADTLASIIQQLTIQASMEERQQLVDITGSVRFPGRYPLAKNMTAHQLISLGGGLKENALGTDAEITRYDIDDQRQTVAVHLEINLQRENPLLLAGDTLRVKQIPLWKTKESVELVGEVMHPGRYYILPGETLMDVLNRAGGLTPHAYPEGAVFSREDLRILEEQRLQDLRVKIEGDIAASSLQTSEIVKADVDAAEAERILNNIESIKPLGRMVIDLPAIIRDAEDHDFQLIAGDVLNIPRYKPSVTVVGEVQYPTSHFFDRKFNAFDYIDRSGGTKQNADKKRIYIVKANGQVILPKSSAWFKSKTRALDPGDTIIVPLDTDKVDSLTLWSSVTGIISQTLVSVAAVVGLFN